MSDAEIEKDLRDALRRLLARHSGVEAVAALADRSAAWDPDLWAELTGIGVPGLPVPAEHGGEGAGWHLAATALEELGRRLALVPASSTYAAQAALVAASDPGTAPYLERLADGRLAGTVAAGRTADGWTPAGDLHASPRDGSWRLDGTVPVVADALAVGVVLAAAQAADGPALFLVDTTTGPDGHAASPDPVDPGEPAGAPVELSPLDSLDPTRPLAALTLRHFPARLVAGPDRFAEVLRAAEHAALLGLAAEAVGVAAEATDMAVAYAGTRRQFGRPIGSFQAVSHRLADMFVEAEAARALVAAAAQTLDNPRADKAETEIAVCLAAAHALDTAVQAAQGCLQAHGGMGFTWEHPAHRYLRRAKAAQASVALPDRLRERAARALLDTVPAAAG